LNSSAPDKSSGPATAILTGFFRKNILLVFLLAGYAVYAGAFILSTSIEVGRQRYFVLFDDAMISMRYAENLAHGYGLVWNGGEMPVEGYTNTLWTLYMAIFHCFPIARSWICLPVQVTGVIIQIAAIILIKKICELYFGKDKIIVWLPVLLTAFYLPLNSWSLQGMEVGLLALLLLAVAFQVQKILAGGASSTIPLYLLLGTANLVRMDCLIPGLITIAFLCWFDPRKRARHLIQGGLSQLLSLGCLEIFRIAYFHDLLPNTYYLKLSGYPILPRIAQGAYSLGRFLLQSNPWLFAIALFGLRQEQRKFLIYLAAVVFGQFAYSVYVGGDAWENWGNRYITEAMPLFFILFACGIQSLADLRTKEERNSYIPRTVAILIASLSPLSFNNIPGLKNLFLLDRPICYDYNKTRVPAGLALDKILLPRATIATSLSGTLPFFANRRDVDILGKCDPVVAKEEMHRLEKIVPAEASWRWFYPGHMKWDYKHSISELDPDVVADLWACEEEARPFLASKYTRMLVDGYPFYLKKGSRNIIFSSGLIAPMPPSGQNAGNPGQTN
jgi:arabinofuranosyltransferase